MFDAPKNYSTSAKEYPNYYKDISKELKEGNIDILIVVNMFLTGFDSKLLNTLWVDKNLQYHGLIQAFSRTNRTLNSVKKYGNIICFRDLKKDMEDALTQFGNEEASSIVLLKTFKEYYEGYEKDGRHQLGYKELVEKLQRDFPLENEIVGDAQKKDFIRLFGAIIRLRNILVSFDDFNKKEILSKRDKLDYDGRYYNLKEELRPKDKLEKESINDDIEFELELMMQVEVGIEYILDLVLKYKESNSSELSLDIEKAIDSSTRLRSKKKLIQEFIEKINTTSDIENEWQGFMQEKQEEDLNALIKEEGLKELETKHFVENAFEYGYFKTTGTDFDGILPPISLFGSNNKAIKKQTVIEKLEVFFDKYMDRW
jgi:type I restriction enzyme R subunit